MIARRFGCQLSEASEGTKDERANFAWRGFLGTAT